jgi:cyclic pyranopterin phosphate synthase
MLRAAMLIKPERHEFDLEKPPQIVRFMNMTGG